MQDLKLDMVYCYMTFPFSLDEPVWWNVAIELDVQVTVHRDKFLE